MCLCGARVLIKLEKIYLYLSLSVVKDSYGAVTATLTDSCCSLSFYSGLNTVEETVIENSLPPLVSLCAMLHCFLSR